MSTLNNAPLAAALASKPATPTSVTALAFPVRASDGSFESKSSAREAVSNGTSAAA